MVEDCALVAECNPRDRKIFFFLLFGRPQKNGLSDKDYNPVTIYYGIRSLVFVDLYLLSLPTSLSTQKKKKKKWAMWQGEMNALFF